MLGGRSPRAGGRPLALRRRLSPGLPFSEPGNPSSKNRCLGGSTHSIGVGAWTLKMAGAPTYFAGATPPLG